jgi:hypothetical protein
VGLLLYGKAASRAKADSATRRGSFFSAFERMKAWFQGNF